MLIVVFGVSFGSLLIAGLSNVLPAISTVEVVVYDERMSCSRVELAT